MTFDRTPSHIQKDSRTLENAVEPLTSQISDPKAIVLENKIGEYVHELLQQDSLATARILEESQIETIVIGNLHPIINFQVGNQTLFQKRMEDLAGQVTPLFPDSDREKIVNLFKKKFLEEACPLLEWQRELNELENAFQVLKQDISSKKKEKSFSTEINHTASVIQKLLDNLHSSESRSILPEPAVQWEVSHLLKKSKTIHTRLEENKIQYSLHEVDEELKEVKSLLEQLTGKPLTSEEKKSGLGSLADWFGTALKRSQSEQDASDFAFTEKFHQPIEELQSRMVILGDRLNKLKLANDDTLVIEYQQLRDKVQSYYDAIEFRIAYFAQEAALENVIKELNVQKGDLMVGKLNFSPQNLEHVMEELSSLQKIFEMHQKNARPKLRDEIEKKSQYQITFAQDQISHFLAHIESEIGTEYREILAHLQKDENPDESRYALNALYEECCAFIDSLEMLLKNEGLPNEIVLALEHSLKQLDGLADALDKSLDETQTIRETPFDRERLKDIQDNRSILTLEKKRRKWQKESYYKIETEKEAKTFFEQLFRADTPKNIFFFYLKNLTKYVSAFYNLETPPLEGMMGRRLPSHPESESQTEIARLPIPQLSSLQAVQIRPGIPAAEKMHISAERVNQTFNVTLSENLTQLMSSFASSSPLVPSELFVEKNLENGLLAGEKSIKKLQSQVSKTKKVLTQRQNQTKNEDRTIETIQADVKLIEERIKDLKPSPKPSEPIPNVVNWLREIESISRDLKLLQRSTMDQTL